jgi:Tfp pilus assembly protein PilO
MEVTLKRRLRQEKHMTETRELDALTEALSIIDRALGEMLHRELVSTNEVADLLLDIRSLVASEAAVLVQS